MKSGLTHELADYHEDFASIYDEMHAAVYSPDADLEAVVRHTRLKPGARILDFGCGTGSHAVALAKAGYSVLGIDISEPMIAVARAKACWLSSVGFRCCDADELAAAADRPTFDGVIAFSNVLNCLPNVAAMEMTLRALAHMMRPGALGLVDVWNILPLVKNGTRDTVRPLSVPGGDIVQTMRASFDADAQTLAIDYLIFVSRDGRRTWRHITSLHRLQLLKPEQYERLFAATGFAVRSVVLQHARDDSREVTSDDRLVCYIVERV